MNIVDQIEALLARGVTHALTLWPEWQFPILNLDKRVENRTWAPPRSLVGATIALHFGKHIGGRPGRQARLDGCRDIVAVARRAGWVVASTGAWSLEFKRGNATHLFDADKLRTSAIACLVRVLSVTPPGPVCAEDPWYVGKCGWRFELVDALETPIQCKGAQGLWPLRSLLGHDVGEARAGAVWGYAPRRAT